MRRAAIERSVDGEWVPVETIDIIGDPGAEVDVVDGWAHVRQLQLAGRGRVLPDGPYRAVFEPADTEEWPA